MPTNSASTPFRLWAFGDAHVGTDKRFGRDSLAESITQSESGGPDAGSGFSWDEQRWGTWFLNAASLSRYHMPLTTLPISRLLTFTPGSRDVRVQCYLHTSQYASQGWYPWPERTLTLGAAFRWS